MKPKLICLTPVKNEGWILNTFLSYTSEWADYIIIADQGSQDNTKSIALSYPKVIYVENKSIIYNEAERQLLLIAKAREIPGPKILFTLDADELLSLNYRLTNDWNKIINSVAGDVFGLQWANLNADKLTYSLSEFYYPWIVNDNGCEHKNYIKAIHSMRIPFPDSAHNGWNHINEFKVLHFNYMHIPRLISKNRYYQCLHFMLDLKETPISLHRSYNLVQNMNNNYLPDCYVKDDRGYIFDNINLSINKYWWDDEVIQMIVLHGSKKFRLLNIWMDINFNQTLKESNIPDVRNFTTRYFHVYLNKTQRFYPSIIISIIDKIICKILKLL